MFLQPPWLPSHGQLHAPQNWNPTVYGQANLYMPGQVPGQVYPSAPNGYNPDPTQPSPVN